MFYVDIWWKFFYCRILGEKKGEDLVLRSVFLLNVKLMATVLFLAGTVSHPTCSSCHWITKLQIPE